MYMAISMDSLSKEFLQGMCKEYILHYYIRYMEISMDPFCKEFLNKSQCYRVHGNFHGPFTGKNIFE